MAGQKKAKRQKPWYESRSTRPLFEYCATPWTPEERAVGDVDRAPFEGKYEKSRRMRLGLPLIAGQGSIDIPEFGEEVKCLETTILDKDGIPGLSSQIRMGQSLKDMSFGEAIFEIALATAIAEDGHQLLTDKSVIDAFKSLAVTEEILSKVPEPYQGKIRELWKPSKVMEHIPTAVCLTSQYGFLLVPKTDFDIAFRFLSTSQSRLNFSFDWNYLRNKIRIEHEQKKDRDDELRLRNREDDKRETSHPSGETVSGQGFVGNTEGTYKSGRIGDGVCPKGDPGRDGSSCVPDRATVPCEMQLPEREEDCRFVPRETLIW